ncbi:hypothetical protein EVAR_94330_1 [Eumeta japonica]|uniref:DUF659 domain-containing protein n=1 Tax=Eumeta variegata TaxID=151549 RepID=A0A4C1UF41_EUMVA|nr:hypothetical protein EVAR_94330_1 [Eumeta japonica]
MPPVSQRPNNPYVVGVRVAGDGSLFINDGKHARDIERRVSAGNTANGALLAIMNSKSVSRQACLAVHNGVLILTLVYGSESVNAAKCDICIEGERDQEMKEFVYLEHIAEMLLKTCTEWGMDSEKVWPVVTDNAANMVKAVDLTFGKNIRPVTNYVWELRRKRNSYKKSQREGIAHD